MMIKGKMFYPGLWNPMLESDDMEMRSEREWCHMALKTLFSWALIDCEGSWPLYLISNMWIKGSSEPDVMYKPLGDQSWFTRADCVSLLCCFHPNAWTSFCFNLISNNRSCFSWVLQQINKQNNTSY